MPVGEGSMIAVLGASTEEIKNFIKEIKNLNVCEIANDNAIGQVIVSGDKKNIESLKEILKKKKKFIPLNVSAPFHCSLMKPAPPESMASKIKLLLLKSLFSK
ncbi:MAG: hypothetical protein CM15mP15_2950 [Prochlorococcus sp.]|nr:MAG: hypothetical protein CM15mP15_2950 [Prochlorococcus sp.]